jgi:UDP-2,3-diacylglucosamine pyrophosphatase LpxH
MPYISASIIIQMMAMVVPQLMEWRKEGESGRRKLTEYTRYLTVILGSFQSFACGRRAPERRARARAGVPVAVHGHYHHDHRHAVPDVLVSRSRARCGQRHLDDHSRGHRRRPAGRRRQHAEHGEAR